MCGRYTLYGNLDLSKRFDAKNTVQIKRGNYNVAPGQQMPVIIESERGRTIEPMKWGLVPMWAKDTNIGYKMINARAESVYDKPAWRGPVRHHRCLIPATGFYEWKREAGQKTKQPYFIKPKDIEVFAFAGIFDVNTNALGEELWSFSIVTTEPNREMTAIHDRMPVILHQADESAWLSPSHDNDRGAIEALLRPWEDDGLEMFEVSSDVNVVKNNDEKLIYPLNSQ